jgi:hypothetical protein
VGIDLPVLLKCLGEQRRSIADEQALPSRNDEVLQPKKKSYTICFAKFIGLSAARENEIQNDKY